MFIKIFSSRIMSGYSHDCFLLVLNMATLGWCVCVRLCKYVFVSCEFPWWCACLRTQHDPSAVDWYPSISIHWSTLFLSSRRLVGRSSCCSSKLNDVKFHYIRKGYFTTRASSQQPIWNVVLYVCAWVCVCMHAPVVFCRCSVFSILFYCVYILLLPHTT